MLFRYVLMCTVALVLTQPSIAHALEHNGSSWMDDALNEGAAIINFGEQNSGWRDDSSKVYTDCSTSSSNACNSERSIILGSHDYDDGWVSLSREFTFTGKSACYSHAEIEMRIQTNGPRDSDNPGWIGASLASKGDGKANKLLFYSWDYENSNWDIINANSNYEFENGNKGTVLTQNDGKGFRTISITIPLEGTIYLTGRNGAYSSNHANHALQELTTDFSMNFRVLNHPAEDDWSDSDLRTEISGMEVRLLPKTWIGIGVSLSSVDENYVSEDAYFSKSVHEFNGQGAMPDTCLTTEPVSLTIGSNGTQQFVTLYEPQVDFSNIEIFDGEVNLEFSQNDKRSNLTLQMDTTPPEGILHNLTTDVDGIRVRIGNMSDLHSGLSGKVSFSLVGTKLDGSDLEHSTTRSYYRGSYNERSFENLFTEALSGMNCEGLIFEVRLTDRAYPPNEKVLTKNINDACPEPQSPDFLLEQTFDEVRGGGILVAFNPLQESDEMNTVCTLRVSEVEPNPQFMFFELSKGQCEHGQDFFLQLTTISNLTDNLNFAAAWCEPPRPFSPTKEGEEGYWEEVDWYMQEEDRKNCWSNSSKTTEHRFVVDSHAPVVTIQFDDVEEKNSLEITSTDMSGIGNLSVRLHYANGVVKLLQCNQEIVTSSAYTCLLPLNQLQHNEMENEQASTVENIFIHVQDVFGNEKETRVASSILAQINDTQADSSSTTVGSSAPFACLGLLAFFVVLLYATTSSSKQVQSRSWQGLNPRDARQFGYEAFTDYSSPFPPLYAPPKSSVQPIHHHGRTDKNQIRNLVNSNPNGSPKDILALYNHPPNAKRIQDRTILKHIRRAIEANRPKAKPDIRQIKRLIVQSTDDAPATILKGYIHPPHKKQVDESVLLTIIADKVESIDKDRKDLNRELDGNTVIELLVFANSLGFQFTTRNSKKEELLLELKNFILIEEPVSVLDIKRKSEVQPKGKRKDTPMGPIPFNFPFQCSAGAKKGVADGEVMCLYDHIDSIMKKPLRWLGRSCPVCEDGVVEQRITNIYFG